MEWISIFIGIYLIFSLSDVKKLIQKSKQNAESEESEVLKDLIGKRVEFRFESVSDHALEKIAKGKVTKVDPIWLTIEAETDKKIEETLIRITDISTEITVLEETKKC